ncbi:hypothetical protein CK203_081266 [Vitis vinifera]|uniref:Retrotransposon gag domain-containing protein n=1 Tax=Vitis vinifera TaxID=29760 RepID=A0A438DAN8_VITVI|nr:hypothetical protein CK203_081266 [Vitis vinifera]
MTCSPRPFALISPITSPQGIPRTKVFHIRWDQRSLRSHHALSTAYDARYWQRCIIMQSIPASLQGQALSWFHRLPPNSIDNFRDLSEAFVGQYLCSARHKQNISTLQNIKMRDNESLREFVKRFGQAVLQIEVCSMDAVLQIFKRSIVQALHFSNLAKKPPTTMDDLFRRANKYSMLEDDVCVQPLSKFWLPDGLLEITRTDMPNLRTAKTS